MFFKQIFLSFLLLLTVLIGKAQVMFCPKVIPSNGGLNIAGNTMLSWTVGETATLTFQSDSLLLTQGFQQVYPSLPSKVPAYSVIDEITLSPNPTNGIVNIGQVPTGTILTIINEDGMLALQQKNNSGNTQINISSLPNGMYLFYLQNNGVNLKTFKVVKE